MTWARLQVHWRRLVKYLLSPRTSGATSRAGKPASRKPRKMKRRSGSGSSLTRFILAILTTLTLPWISSGCSATKPSLSSQDDRACLVHIFTAKDVEGAKHVKAGDAIVAGWCIERMLQDMELEILRAAK